ncbi:MAG: hypothetical protein AAF738_06335 [Bacteroidota bacterium]
MKQLAYKNINSKGWEKLKRAMKDFGVEIEGDQGDISAKGIKGSFKRDADSETLEIIINKTPMLLPSGILAGQITGLVERLGGKVA